MNQAKKKIAYLNINRFNPALCDGVSTSSLELLQFLKDQGYEVVILTYLTNEPYKQNIFYKAIHQYNWKLNDKKPKSFSYMINNILVYEELFPFNETDLPDNQNHILKSMNNKISEFGINYLITAEDDSFSLLPGSILGIPGAHFFHSPAYLSYYRQCPLFLKLLKKRNLFAVSGFLQAKIKKELGLNSDIWYPIFDLGKYRLKKRLIPKKQAGYYSAGWHKGDDIFNRLIIDIPDWDYTVIGRHYTHGFNQIPKNLNLWGENTDFKKFYNSIALLLVPSLTEEGFPRVILEAAVNGIPAIVNSLGGIPEALGDSGILVELNASELERIDIKRLVAIYRKHIKRIDTDTCFYKELQQKAINRARRYEHKQAELSKINLKKMFAN